VRTHADGHRLNPSGLQFEPVGSEIVVKGVEKNSPLYSRLSRLQRKYPEADFSVQQGDGVIAVNGETQIDSMLRALHWKPAVTIHFRRYEYPRKVPSVHMSSVSTRDSWRSGRKRFGGEHSDASTPNYRLSRSSGPLGHTDSGGGGETQRSLQSPRTWSAPVFTSESSTGTLISPKSVATRTSL